MSETPPFHMRPPMQGDIQFILSSWLKSFRNSEFANYIPNKLYYEFHGSLVKNIIARSLVSILCDVEDPEHVYGYVVYELLGDVFILHYIYIKYNFRNLGLCRTALKAVYPQFGNVESFITHPDKVLSRIVNNEIKKTSFFIKKRDDYKLIYNPFALIR